MKNDGVLAGLGIDPVTIALAAGAIYNLTKSWFGPGKVAQMRHEYVAAGDRLIAKYRGLIPSLPEWVRPVVSADVDTFWLKMHPQWEMRNGQLVTNLSNPPASESDYQNAFGWMEGREAVWSTMKPPEAVAPRAVTTVTPSGAAVTTVTPSGAVVRTIDQSGYVVQTAVPGGVPQQAGYNLPVMLAVGGVLAWLLLGKK